MRNANYAAKASIVRYCSDLLDCGDMPLHEMHSLRRQLDAFFYKAGYEYVNLQVGDNDLIGNKFNGHNLHLLLNDCGVNSFHIVRNKQSNDSKTIQLDRNTDSDYSWQILHSKEYIYSDIVHLHLIHNTDFDLCRLPLFTSLKPTVITLHDPFSSAAIVSTMGIVQNSRVVAMTVISLILLLR